MENLTAQLADTGPESGPARHQLPEALDAAVARLGASVGPEVAGAWNRLTPSAFRVEVAGPELPESTRLDRALSLMEEVSPHSCPTRPARICASARGSRDAAPP